MLVKRLHQVAECLGRQAQIEPAIARLV
jgi:hypothetical protein